MKITKYLSANLLSLSGNIGFLICFCALLLYMNLLPDFRITSGIIAYLMIYSFRTYIYIIPWLILLLPIDILINTFLHNKYTINIPIKNEHLYHVIFWFGIICSIIYLFAYYYFATRLLGK